MTATPASSRMRLASPSACSMALGEIDAELKTDTRSCLRSPCLSAAVSGDDQNRAKPRPYAALKVNDFMAAPLHAAEVAGGPQVPQCQGYKTKPKWSHAENREGSAA